MYTGWKVNGHLDGFSGEKYEYVGRKKMKALSQ
jgi:hypothetical protein